MSTPSPKLLVVLPSSPSAVTKDVMAGIRQAWDDSLFPKNAIVWARELSDVVRGKSLEPAELSKSLSEDLPSTQPLFSEWGVLLSHLTIQDVRWVLFLGGKTEARMAWELSELASECGSEVCVGLIPDDYTNSLGATDHCLGFASFARSYCDFVAGDDLDNQSYFKGVKLILAPGFENGWAAAAAGLASELHSARNTIPDAGPHLIYVPEAEFSQEIFCRDVNESLEKYGRSTVVVSKALIKKIPELEFEAGSAALAGLRLSEFLVASLRASGDSCRELSDAKIKASTCNFRGRSFLKRATPVDSAEAFRVGVESLNALVKSRASGFMMSLKRTAKDEYESDLVSVEIQTALFNERSLPAAMVPQGTEVITQEFLAYILPLIGMDSPNQNASNFSFSAAISAAVRRVSGFARSRHLHRGPDL
jgi:6-phosphofructokinase